MDEDDHCFCGFFLMESGKMSLRIASLLIYHWAIEEPLKVLLVLYVFRLLNFDNRFKFIFGILTHQHFVFLRRSTMEFTEFLVTPVFTTCCRAEFSPNLKSIEPCFSLAQNWLRRHENAALLEPVLELLGYIINSAFHIHAIGGERAASVRWWWGTGTYSSKIIMCSWMILYNCSQFCLS